MERPAHAAEGTHVRSSGRGLFGLPEADDVAGDEARGIGAEPPDDFCDFGWFGDVSVIAAALDECPYLVRNRRDGSRTRLTFLQAFPRGFRQQSPAPTGDPGGDPGGDLPGGPDTPWWPGFVAGFHLMLDDLAKLLSIELERRGDWIDGHVPNELGVYPPDWVWLCHLYHEHIKIAIPKS